MIFDVIIREGYKYSEQQKRNVPIINIGRVHDSVLSKYLREVQDAQKYIISVIPLFRKKVEQEEQEEQEEQVVDPIEQVADPIDSRIMIDSQGM